MHFYTRKLLHLVLCVATAVLTWIVLSHWPSRYKSMSKKSTFPVIEIKDVVKITKYPFMETDPVVKTKHPVVTTKVPATTAKARAIDMVNDYHPYIDFKFVYPQIVPHIQETQDLFLIVLVNSGANDDKFRKRRETIRQTWGSQKTCEQLRVTDQRITKLKWILVFVVGKAGEETRDERNKEEAEKYNDMIIGDVEDNYLNNIIKLYMGQFWVASTMTQVKYILKTDDDVYVRIPRVLEYLADEGFPNKYYGGARYFETLVQRRIGKKWAVSWKYYAEKTFPPFHPGAFIVLSTDLLSSLFHYVHVRKPFHTDDAYIGVAMRHLNVTARKIPTFVVTLINVNLVIRQRSDCETLKIIAVGHKVGPNLSLSLHKRVEGLCQKGLTFMTCK